MSKLWEADERRRFIYGESLARGGSPPRLEYANRNLRGHVLLSLNDGVIFYHRSAEIEKPCIEWTFRRNVSVHEVCN